MGTALTTGSAYALLILPAANRVYAQAAPRLTLAELEVFNRSLLGDRIGDLQETTIAGVPYVFRRGAFDVLVADLPYGVQHGSRTAERGLRRGPAELLAAALPAWTELLGPGGALGVSWNTHVARRDQLAASMTSAGLQVLDSDPYPRFQHRVDQAIARDLLVARRPRRLRTS
ncbi:MAG TPA: hypothetical protein VE664_06895 [Actinomycetes bacterium]|jgi:tRNA G10  N-methylase Trm11|nr:hypothetical protein [Actinomycetes bacterium]